MVECKSLMHWQYFEELLRSILSLKNFIVADRNGYWNGHLQAVQDLLPLFRECESINYLRYASLYLRTNAESTHGSSRNRLYAHIQLDHFVVKEKKKKVLSMQFHLTHSMNKTFKGLKKCSCNSWTNKNYAVCYRM